VSHHDQGRGLLTDLEKDSFEVFRIEEGTPLIQD